MRAREISYPSDIVRKRQPGRRERLIASRWNEVPRLNCSAAAAAMIGGWTIAPARPCRRSTTGEKAGARGEGRAGFGAAPGTEGACPSCRMARALLSSTWPSSSSLQLDGSSARTRRMHGVEGREGKTEPRHAETNQKTEPKHASAGRMPARGEVAPRQSELTWRRSAERVHSRSG